MNKNEILRLIATALENNENPKKQWIVDTTVDYSRVTQTTGITIYIIGIKENTIADSFRSWDCDENGRTYDFEDAKLFLKKYGIETGD